MRNATSFSNVEILAPAGSFDSLQAAAKAGANAIYFGVEQLNMRARSAGTFTIEDIAEVAAICKLHNMKAYITLNTVMYGHDMQLLKTILKAVKTHGIDAVIASDFAVFEYCTQMQIPLHISTQTNVSNIESVQYFARFADVIVLARELTLKQVHEITSEIKRRGICGPSGQLVKIEIFVHGALCMAVSGKCYLSLHTQNASANRGACIQNCRHTYTVRDTETGDEFEIDNEYIMSPKDLCTIDILDQIIESGVGVLKIEGRTKGADYVHVVTTCYREALEAVLNGTYNREKVASWMQELAKVYNRGFWEGYYLGRKLGEWTHQPGSVATERKIYLGKGSNYFGKIKVGEFLIETGTLKAGDQIMVSGPRCGMVREQLHQLIVNGAEGTMAGKGDSITFPFATKVTANDKLYKIVEAANG